MSVRRATLLVFAFSVGLWAVTLVWLTSSWDAPVGSSTWGFRGFELLNGIAYTIVGGIVTVRRPANNIGRLLIATGVLWSLIGFLFEYAVYAIPGRPEPLAGGLLAAWACSWLWTINVELYPVLFAIFPDGRMSSPARRAIALGAAIGSVFLAAYFAVRPGPLQIAGFVDNPVTLVSPSDAQVVGTIAQLVTLPVAVGAAGLLVLRFRRSTGVERQQLKWLAYSALPVVVVGPFSGIVPAKPIEVLSWLTQLGVPVAIAVAVLRYRLYDIDVLINRTLVYGSTSAVIAASFFGGVVLLQAILSPFTSGSEIAVAVSTLASVALIQPLRRRLQEAVDRRFYRSRYDASHTLDRFSERLRDEVDLDAVRADLVVAVRDTVQPAHASLWLRERSQ